MKLKLLILSIAASLGLISHAALATNTSVTVTIENLAPSNGTFQTPHWVGFHDGSFDIYNSGDAANSLPAPGSFALERLAEDGNNAVMTEIFGVLQPAGQDATIAGPNGPIGPGDVATMTFIIDSTSAAQRFFSYGSMVLPSNDFFYANANPVAHPLFNENGDFIATDFFLTNQSIRDAGTEVNDEIPANTAFFGQASPNTGVDENSKVVRIRDNPGLVRFNPASSGGILADERFAMSDFGVVGYPLIKISFTAEPIIEPVFFNPFTAQNGLDSQQTVPRTNSNARGQARYVVAPEGVKYTLLFRNLKNLRMAHLHLGVRGEAGPVIANLLPADFDPSNRNQLRRLSKRIKSTLTAADLVGPLEGQPISALAQAIRDGNVYTNIHTVQNPSGELRGQVAVRH